MSASRAAGKSIDSGDGACTITADAIAALVGGELIGDGRAEVSAVAPLERAQAGHLSVLSKAKYEGQLQSSKAGVVLVDPEFRDSPASARARIIVANPMEKMLAVIPKLYAARPDSPGIAATARIGKNAAIGRNVSVGEYAVIGAGVRMGDGAIVGAHCVVGDSAELGAGSRLHPNVTVYAGAKIGERSVIHSGATIGSDGFGYAFRNGVHEKIPHVGGCVIGDDVEIGAGTTIDRGSIDDTVIGDGTKIDNLVQIAHNVRVGKKCLIMSQVGIAGSTIIEDGCVLAGQAGLGGHITVGRGAKIAGQSGVFGDVPAGESWSGYPARPHRESLRATGALFKLSGLMKRLEKLLDEKAPE